MTDNQSEWALKYNYREARSINCCELCSYAEKIDLDGHRGVEALICSAATNDTGQSCPVGFDKICDLFNSELLQEKPDA